MRWEPRSNRPLLVAKGLPIFRAAWLAKSRVGQISLAEQDDGVHGPMAFDADVNPPTSESPEPQPLWMLAPAMGGLALARCRRGRKS